jgi:membrane-bound lytic murein transglycosylase D
MREARWATLAFALCTAACATAPVPQPAPGPVLSSDAVEFRAALESAYARIAAQEQTPIAAPRVDVKAAASIPIPEHRTIRDALAYFTTDLKSDIQQSLIRSAQYKNLIDRVLDEYKLPKGLAYLPVIESAYQPTLTSRAGAHGIWQFMPETAREYGLRVDWWVDERADPDLSTRAAAAYLKDLYRDFQDWSLALAAYNAGPNRIHRALADTHTTTFWDLLELSAVPRETRGYVPTFFASLIIASDPSAYGFRLSDAVDSNVKPVEVDGPLSLRFLAESANIDEGLLRDLNPALRQGVVPPGRVTVRVPAKAAESIEARARTMKNDDSHVAICTYTVRDGDNLKRLARTIGTTPQTILAMNGVRRLRRGESIYLPVRARELGNLLAGRRKARRGDTALTGGM